MWERAHVGFGGTRSKRKGPCMKQCAWRKPGLCDMHLAEACPPKLRNNVKYRVEEMSPQVVILEAPCAQNAPGRSTMRPPEALLPPNPTCQISGLAILCDRLLQDVMCMCISLSTLSVKRNPPFVVDFLPILADV